MRADLIEQKQKAARILSALAVDTGRPNQQPNAYMNTLTRKQFREHLNRSYPFNDSDPRNKGTNGRLGATKRAYGDYLWYNDRGMFESDYQQFLKKETTATLSPNQKQ